MDSISPSLKKYQNLIFPVVAVFIGLGLLGLVIIPQGLKIPETNTQIESTRRSLNALNTKINQLNGVDVNKYQDDLNSSLLALPGEKDFPGVMTLVFNLLKNNGMTLNGISFSGLNEAAVSGPSTFLIKVDVNGSKDSLTNLISQLKDSPRIMKVDSIATSASLTSTTLEITAGLNSFYQPIPKSQVLDLEKPIDLPNQKNQETLAIIKSNQAKNAALTTDATASGNVQLGKPDPFQ